MAVTFVGVRHHSPACARLVRRAIRELAPAYVLVEGPADFSPRLDELLLGHELPVAIFSHYRDESRVHASWSPFCAYSPEWVAVTEGRAAGADVRFIDLPAWHPAFAHRRNRYADADERYAEATARLCREFAVDNTDTLWDHLFEAEPSREDVPPSPGPAETEPLRGDDPLSAGPAEIEPTREDGSPRPPSAGPAEFGADDGLAERLDAYFDLVRGESAAGADDAEREAYMARWIRAAVARAGDRPVLVVTGGFHTPALRAMLAAGPGGDEPDGWPEVPAPPEDATGGSYLVPYSFKRLDSFTGYQSGMPSPEYYQRLWESGPERAAGALTEIVVTRLRERRQVVSTADLIAARTLTDGLARLRGHRTPSRTDLLDGLVAALVTDDLDQPLPWTTRGPLAPGAHPAVVEMVAALAGRRVGRLKPGTPAPPLLHDVVAELERLKLDHEGEVTIALARGLTRSRALHRMRVLNIPGVTRLSGPSTGTDPVTEERWDLRPGDDRTPALIEAGAYGATLLDAALAVLEERTAAAGTDVAALASVLFDAVLCGCTDLSGRVAGTLAAGLAGAGDLGELGRVLGTVLGLWRHDGVLGTAGSPLFATVIEGCVTRVMWLAEGIRGGPAPADLPRLAAMAALRDALLHAAEPLGLDRSAALALAGRIGANTGAPPDLRGAAFGLAWSLGAGTDPARAARGAAGPRTLGDWLAGVFALARDEVLSDERMLAVLDELVAGLAETDFLVALPALRQAFEFFPPRERERIAQGLLDRRGMKGSARAFLRTAADPMVIAEASELEERVTGLLTAEGLLPWKEPA
ncbi:DUF5682 family protein [Spirillospora sp. CA-294931]|uniref:DUF5682 family protein n=1 Tax=Spirillospora sp. CA-294931 TaxID=3240042 RepID=UPI003D9339E5